MKNYLNELKKKLQESIELENIEIIDNSHNIKAISSLILTNII